MTVIPLAHQTHQSPLQAKARVLLCDTFHEMASEPANFIESRNQLFDKLYAEKKALVACKDGQFARISEMLKFIQLNQEKILKLAYLKAAS
jgi:hypothetical protein